MDDWKQLAPDSLDFTEDFFSLASTLQANGITVVDLLSSESNADSRQSLSHISKSSGRSIRELESYIQALKSRILTQPTRLQDQLSNETERFIKTGLPSIDQQLGGGIPLGDITEVFGASGCGKSHLLNQLSLQCQLATERKECIHIATESFLETKRLKEMQDAYLEAGLDVLLQNVSYIYCQDLESQDHIMYTQLPTKLEEDGERIKMIIIDSIAQHLRREDALSKASYLRERIELQEEGVKNYKDYQEIKHQHQNQLKKFHKSEKYNNRILKYHYLYLLHRHLNRLAQKYNVAVVLINQVSDFASDDANQTDDPYGENDPLNLDFQTSIHSGWDMKTIFRRFEQNFDSPVQLSTRDIEILETELYRSFSTNNKRQKYDNDIDPRYTNRNNSEEDEHNRQKDLLLKLHKLKNVQTKKHVPTLGYTWSKRIVNRVMLMKFYRPLLSEAEGQRADPETGLSYDQLCEGFNLTQNDLAARGKKRSNEDLPFQSYINGWMVERYAKVVSSRYNTSTISGNSVEISINERGLLEIK